MYEDFGLSRKRTHAFLFVPVYGIYFVMKKGITLNSRSIDVKAFYIFHG